MALSPESLNLRLQDELKKAEQIIDEHIAASRKKSVKIDIAKLPNFSEIEQDIRKMYTSVGWNYQRYGEYILLIPVELIPRSAYHYYNK